ncbi:MAG: hypothetical protein HY868_00120 [Chloroflexi bacterium]|nr:hypothetical protein [Chloroflexota bacterium]
MFQRQARWVFRIVLTVGFAWGLLTLATTALAQGAVTPVNSGFDPATHAFSFENYGGDSGFTNLTPIEMKRLFGNQVCVSEEGGNCLLSPVAKQWMDETNKQMNGGHCEGMAVLAALFYTGKSKPADFGAPLAKDMPIIGNEQLQREIAFWWATQATMPTRTAVIKATPKDIVAQLADAFKPGKDASDTFSIGIYKRDGSGGHAVTPYAIVDKGNGIANILVYDNNYPNQERAIIVDVNANTWQYKASINPSVEADLYEGDATTMSLDLTPASARLSTQLCTFCEASANRVNGSAAPITQYNEIYLDGAGVRALITDDKGNKLGRVDNKIVNEIPGALIQRFKAGVETWSQDEEPNYLVPLGVKFTITLDGTALKKETRAGIAMIGPGYSLDIEDIKIVPGQKDTLDVSPDGSKLSYKPGKGESPDIELAIEGKDKVDYDFLVKGFDLEEGGAVNVALDVKRGQLSVNTIGNKKAGSYDLAIGRYDSKGEQEFGNTFKLEPADTVYVDYGKWQGNGKPLTVEIDYKSDGTIDETVELEDLQK